MKFFEMIGWFVKRLSGHFYFEDKNTAMWLFVGLGNPGEKYAKNRHNVGFMVIDEIADNVSCPAFKKKYQGLVTEGRIGDEKILFLKPQTYMNESGHAVAEAAKFYKIAPERIIVFHDELDLAPAKMRARLGGGLAGHNGLKSMKACLGSEKFWRVRLGIGHPGDKSRVSGYVLSDFSKAEWPDIQDMIWGCARNVEMLLSGQDEEYMTKVAMDMKG